MFAIFVIVHSILKMLHNFSSEIISNVEIEQRDTKYEYHANFAEAFRTCRDFL